MAPPLAVEDVLAFYVGDEVVCRLCLKIGDDFKGFVDAVVSDKEDLPIICDRCGAKC
jgi:hypothetical protein